MLTKKNLTNYKAEILIFLAILFLCLFAFNTIVLNFSKNLYDWNDYPFIIWTIYQNIDNIHTLNLQGIFDTNAFYPFKGALLFSDTLLIWAIPAAILDYLSGNPIFVFNSIFFVNFSLNIAASIFVWRKVFSKSWVLFFASLTTAFSPYVALSLGHFQMLNIWPLLLGLGLVIRQKYTVKSGLLLGIITAAQFAVSVYLGIMLLTVLAIWYVIYLLPYRGLLEKSKLIWPHLLIFGMTLLILFGPLAYRYNQVKNAYGIERDYGEYVLYAAHITDYLFTTHYESFVSNLGIVKSWNQYNKHFLGESAGFPGIILSVLGLIGFLNFKLSRKKLETRIILSRMNIFFLLLLVSGFVFSLGPRMNANGKYLEFPLIYNLILHLNPLFEPIRATARWSFLFFLGLSYFASLGFLQLISKHTKIRFLGLILSILFILEVVPIYRLTEAKNYYPEIYSLIGSICSKTPQVLLEYPLQQQQKGADIISNLTYRTQMQLASVKHKCFLVNGYSGYSPVDYDKYENEINGTVAGGDEVGFENLLKTRKIELLKINKQYLNDFNRDFFDNFIYNNDKFQILSDDENFLLISYWNYD